MVWIDAVEKSDAVVVFQNRWGGDTMQLLSGNFSQGHRKIQAAEQLPDLVKIQPWLSLQKRLDLFANPVAIERHSEVLGQRFTDRHWDVPLTTGSERVRIG